MIKSSNEFNIGDLGLEDLAPPKSFTIQDLEMKPETSLVIPEQEFAKMIDLEPSIAPTDLFIEPDLEVLKHRIEESSEEAKALKNRELVALSTIMDAYVHNTSKINSSSKQSHLYKLIEKKGIKNSFVVEFFNFFEKHYKESMTMFEFLSDFIEAKHGVPLTDDNRLSNPEIRESFVQGSNIFNIILTLVSDRNQHRKEEDARILRAMNTNMKVIEEKRKFLKEIEECETTIVEELIFSQQQTRKEEGSEIIESRIVKEYICGNCKNLHVANRDFYKFHLVDASVEIRYVKDLLLSLDGNVCPSCGYFNILPKTALAELQEHIYKRYMKSRGLQDLRFGSGVIGSMTIDIEELKQVIGGDVKITVNKGISLNEEEDPLDASILLDNTEYIQAYHKQLRVYRLRSALKGNKKLHEDLAYSFLLKMSYTGNYSVEMRNDIAKQISHVIVRSARFQALSDQLSHMDALDLKDYNVKKLLSFIYNLQEGNNINFKTYSKQDFDKFCDGLFDKLKIEKFPLYEVVEGKDYYECFLPDSLNKLQSLAKSLEEEKQALETVANELRVSILNYPEYYANIILNDSVKDYNSEFLAVLGTDSSVVDFLDKLVDIIIERKAVKLYRDHIATDKELSDRVSRVFDKNRTIENSMENLTKFILTRSNYVNKEFKLAADNFSRVVGDNYYKVESWLDTIYKAYLAYKNKNLFLLSHYVYTLQKSEQMPEEFLEIFYLSDNMIKNFYSSVPSLAQINRHPELSFEKAEFVNRFENVGFSKEELLNYYDQYGIFSLQLPNYPPRIKDESALDYFNNLQSSVIFPTKLPKVDEDFFIKTNLNDFFEQMLYLHDFIESYISSGLLEYLITKGIFKSLRENFMTETYEAILSTDYNKITSICYEEIEDISLPKEGFNLHEEILNLGRASLNFDPDLTEEFYDLAIKSEGMGSSEELYSLASKIVLEMPKETRSSLFSKWIEVKMDNLKSGVRDLDISKVSDVELEKQYANLDQGLNIFQQSDSVRIIFRWEDKLAFTDNVWASLLIEEGV